MGSWQSETRAMFLGIQNAGNEAERPVPVRKIKPCMCGVQRPTRESPL